MQGWVSRMCKFWKYRKHLAVLFAVLLLPFLTSHVQLWIPPNELDGWISVWVKLFSKDTWIHPRLLYLDTSKYYLCFVSYSSYSWMLVIIGLVEDKFFYRLCVGGGGCWFKADSSELHLSCTLFLLLLHQLHLRSSGTRFWRLKTFVL